MIQSVLSAQFETTSEFGSLLRANTPVSRMMTTYTRRGPGQSYLKTVLADRINSLIEHKDLNLEINPLKVSLLRSTVIAPLTSPGVRADDRANRGRFRYPSSISSSRRPTRNRCRQFRRPSHHRPSPHNAHGDRKYLLVDDNR